VATYRLHFIAGNSGFPIGLWPYLASRGAHADAGKHRASAVPDGTQNRYGKHFYPTRRDSYRALDRAADITDAATGACD